MGQANGRNDLTGHPSIWSSLHKTTLVASSIQNLNLMLKEPGACGVLETEYLSFSS